MSLETRHAILASVGTDGDVHPFLGLGSALRDRGFRVTLASHRHFEAQAKRLGFGFCALVEEPETRELWEDARLWHPHDGPRVIARWGARLLERQYRALDELRQSEGGNFVLVGNPGVMAARLLSEKHRIRLASILLQPWMVESSEAPPIMMGGVGFPRWAPRWFGPVYWRFVDAVGMLLFGKELNSLRSKIGLQPMRRPFRWWLSPDFAIGLFPAWYGRPQRDWPRQLKLAGFPVKDGRSHGSDSEEWMSFCRGPKRVVAFTFGTGMMHASELFRAGFDACAALGLRALALTRFRKQLPECLPAHAMHCSYVPLQDLLPNCAALVHHGGIGTVAKALASGAPQLVLPFGFDQLDNAMRIESLGAGRWLRRGRRDARRMAAALGELIQPAMAAKAADVARLFGGANGLDTAADWIKGDCERRSAAPEALFTSI